MVFGGLGVRSSSADERLVGGLEKADRTTESSPEQEFDVCDVEIGFAGVTEVKQRSELRIELVPFRAEVLTMERRVQEDGEVVVEEETVDTLGDENPLNDRLDQRARAAKKERLPRLLRGQQQMTEVG